MTQYFLFKYNLLIVRFFFFIHISNDALNWLLNLSLLHHWEEFFIIRGYIKPCQAVQNQSSWGYTYTILYKKVYKTCIIKPPWSKTIGECNLENQKRGHCAWKQLNLLSKENSHFHTYDILKSYDWSFRVGYPNYYWRGLSQSDRQIDTSKY